MLTFIFVLFPVFYKFSTMSIYYLILLSFENLHCIFILWGLLSILSVQFINIS